MSAPLKPPPPPPIPAFIERRRIAAIARAEENAEERARRSLKRARGRQEGIERMFARDLEEWQKRALLDLSGEPLDRATTLAASLSPADRARLFEELELLAFDQFRGARRLRDSRPEGYEVFERLMRDAREARAAAERVTSRFVRADAQRR